ncbi:Pao retrotransposon peptidase, partial [Opisthorchis viverrini]
MSQSDDGLRPPVLSRNASPTERDAVHSSDNRHMELDLARLHIRELEIQLELQKLPEVKAKKSNQDECDSHTHFQSDPPDSKSIDFALERRLELPKRELQRFNGNPKDYCAFMKAFSSTIEDRTRDDEARLGYLIQYCDGEAKRRIEHCTVLRPNESYGLAKEILRKRFGQNYMVARAFIDDLITGPTIKDGDSSDLSDLAQQLTVCEVTLREMDYSSDLNSQHTIQTIVRRLPSRFLFKWAKVVANFRREDREPEVTDLTAFIEARVDSLCSDYGELALSLASEERARKRPPLSGQIHGRNIHPTQTLAPRIDPRCGVCGEAHYPDQCAQFIGHLIQNVVIPRCIKGPGFYSTTQLDLHVFSDASDSGYGAVAYFLLTKQNGETCCRLVLAKARVAPIKTTTMPRLELVAAVVAAKLAKQIQVDSGVVISSTTLWTDSLIVLYSVRNQSKRFPTSVANRFP